MCLNYDEDIVWDEEVLDGIFDEEPHGDFCEACGSYNLFIEGRCFTCRDCGWSKCSI